MRIFSWTVVTLSSFKTQVMRYLCYMKIVDYFWVVLMKAKVIIERKNFYWAPLYSWTITPDFSGCNNQGYYTKDIQRKILALKVSSRQDYADKLDWFTSHFQNSLYFHLTFLNSSLYFVSEMNNINYFLHPFTIKSFWN